MSRNRATGRDNGDILTVLLGEKASTVKDGGEERIRTYGTVSLFP
jgi:hypothetical protein